MNAYELADELKKCVDDGFTDLVCVCDAANMLRQQADRIAELEDRLSMYEIKDLDKPQIKELSDEEIQEISHDFGEIAWLGETTYNFARAILKKASEK
jgi:sugar phosphate isomerase/epimerase